MGMDLSYRKLLRVSPITDAELYRLGSALTRAFLEEVVAPTEATSRVPLIWLLGNDGVLRGPTENYAAVVDSIGFLV
jgi:hypothetical protein